MNSLLVLVSYHHNKTEKIASVLAKALDSQIKTPDQINPQEIQEFNLIGFGSGIYGAKLHKSLIDFADKLPQVHNKKAFIFSTSAMTGEDKKADDHSSLKKKLQSKGFIVIGEFQCKGFNTNSFMRFWGGMNKGRPNAKDLKNANMFAQNLKKQLQKK